MKISEELFLSIPNQPGYIVKLGERLHNVLKDVKISNSNIKLNHYLHNDLDAEFEERKRIAKFKKRLQTKAITNWNYEDEKEWLNSYSALKEKI